MQYTQDYDELLPARVTITTPTKSWRVLIQPYVKSTQLFACPSNTGNTVTTTDDGGTFMPRSYSINGATTSWFAGKSPSEYGLGQSLAAVGSVAQVVLVGETDPGWAYPEIHLGGTTQEAKDDSFKGHLGQCNFLFVDGHVKSMKPRATGTPVNMWTIEDDASGPTELLDRLNAWQQKVDAG